MQNYTKINDMPRLTFPETINSANSGTVKWNRQYVDQDCCHCIFSESIKAVNNLHISYKLYAPFTGYGPKVEDEMP